MNRLNDFRVDATQSQHSSQFAYFSFFFCLFRLVKRCNGEKKQTNQQFAKLSLVNYLIIIATQLSSNMCVKAMGISFAVYASIVYLLI